MNIWHYWDFQHIWELAQRLHEELESQCLSSLASGVTFCYWIFLVLPLFCRIYSQLPKNSIEPSVKTEMVGVVRTFWRAMTRELQHIDVVIRLFLPKPRRFLASIDGEEQNNNLPPAGIEPTTSKVLEIRVMMKRLWVQCSLGAIFDLLLSINAGRIMPGFGR